MEPQKKKAYQLIILLGFVSLFGDIIYEGARGVSGQYLQVLGVNATRVGLIVGVGEFAGYLFRLISGYFADKTKSYWFFTILGYLLLLSIPLISLTDSWQIVAILTIVERVGKGIRTPARDTIVSHASKQIGSGLTFGISEFIDQIGSIIGPLIFTYVLYNITSNNLISSYQKGFSITLLPYLILLIILLITYKEFKNSEELENRLSLQPRKDKLPSIFHIYTIFTFITTSGFISFSIIGFHLKKYNIISDHYIPLLYALAVGAIDAITGLTIGKYYDILNKKSTNRLSGINLLLIIPISTIITSLFVFNFNIYIILIGIIFFGITLGLQEVILKAIVSDIIHIDKRSTAYGILNISTGTACFFGATLSGYLYDISITFLIVFLIITQLVSILFFIVMRQKLNNSY
ncbi:MAG: MFS transporter [Deferribacterales bacterium]